MGVLITVREFARLRTADHEPSSLDSAQISKSAFAWLCKVGKADNSLPLVVMESHESLRLMNYVGVIQIPGGEVIEILPKHVDGYSQVERSRRLMRRLISVAAGISPREAGEASIQDFEAPATEWVMSRFLRALTRLVRSGLHTDYERVSSEERYLRGQLDYAKQVRQGPGRGHRLHIRNDVLSMGGAENRAVKAALDRVASLTRSAANWRVAQELRVLMHEIPASSQPELDLRRWRNDRLLARYGAVRPWCELILRQRMPLALFGEFHGLSLLFPMEKLFEQFVGHLLARDLPGEAVMRAPAASEYLCEHLGAPMFQLKPDFLVDSEGKRWILDAKWKRLNSSDRAAKYGLGEGDIYQIFAYGSRYLNAASKKVALLYPMTPALTRALPKFDLPGNLELFVIPVDLEGERLVDIELLQLPAK